MNGLIRVVHILACTAIIAQVKSGTKEKLIACRGRGDDTDLQR